jgi:hypothetical protein
MAQTPDDIRTALGKPHLSDASAKAQQRLFNQYWEYIIQTPRQDHAQNVTQITGQALAQTMSDRLVQLGNVQRRGGGTPPAPPPGKRVVVLTPPAGLTLAEEIDDLYPRTERVATLGFQSGERYVQVAILLELNTGQRIWVSSPKKYRHRRFEATPEAFQWIQVVAGTGGRRGRKKQSPIPGGRPAAWVEHVLRVEVTFFQ